MRTIRTSSRHHSAIAVAIFCAYAVVLLSCVVCAADEHCEDPFCDEMEVCHCACAFHVIVPQHLDLPEPTRAIALSDRAEHVLPLDAPRDLFRPPRTSHV